jgi:aryl-alcohol dehydrogenase-like predicted oxidoreductase
MQLRPLGQSGLLVSVVGLGTNNFGMRDDVDARAVVARAIDLGINFFDTAESYGHGRSERVLGEALGERRKDVLIATKWGGVGFPPLPGPHKDKRPGSRDYIMKAVEASLANLKTDYIDLYQFHRPDPHTPIEETLRAVDDLVKAGKVRYIGVSNMPAWQVVDAQWTARELGLHRFICCQDEYSLLQRSTYEQGLKAMMQAHGLGLLPFFPLASGLLTGKYRRGEPYPPGTRFALAGPLAGRFANDRTWPIVERLTAFAASHGHTLLDLAISWLAAQPLVASVIAGATRADQVALNVAAAEWRLTPDELAEVERITSAG